ncbi:hypothetical protein COCCU_14380 (plasmid) [Corynebacterium occultum]|uniref:Uncharacterized protein n=2 Tax=Corynebacterium occultum TaxID=2675219 RepID=A0A6B8WD33_9CORY|nr:hypothetical protein COCCU_14380 [Corynebacterium occultum]
MGVILRRFLIPLGTSVEQLVWPWIVGSFIFLVIVGGVLVAFAAVLYRYRHRHCLAVALGWGIWAGFLVHSLLLFVLSLLIFKYGITPVG